eukprot:Nitzschia sp. Nitz4//scaffold79_size90958//63877//66120//NITZ4_005034-RA/size90958-processed-gene-0.118-mRNA-1//-1//CDS//3329558276//5051//frame0
MTEHKGTTEDEKPVKLAGSALVGKRVRTDYGEGNVVSFRDKDQIYEVELCKVESSPHGFLYTPRVPTHIRTQREEIGELNEAYEALEKMRRLNLEMECHQHGVTQVEYDCCTVCLLSSAEEKNKFPRLQRFVDNTRSVIDDVSSNQGSTGVSSRFPRMGLFGSGNHSTNCAATRAEVQDEDSTILRKESAAFSESATSAPNINASDRVNPNPQPSAVAAPAAVSTPASFPRLRSLGLFARTATTMANSDTTVSEEPPQTAAVSTESDDQSTVTPPNSKPAAASNRIVLPRIQKMLDNRQRSSAAPCLICGNPVCSKHSSSNFSKEGITLCKKCECLFEMDFITECISSKDPKERAKRIEYMLDCYDRCLLLLKYSSRHLEQIATSLEEQKATENSVGLGSSTVGILSGVLGLAAAATILSPAGAPLLMASLFFGGGATAVQTGTEAYNYRTEPSRLANRTIALYGMALSILRAASTLRDSMLRVQVPTDVYQAESDSISDTVQHSIENNRTGVRMATNMGRAATLGRVAGAEMGATASASATATRLATTEATVGARGASSLTRASTAAARTIRFARFAGGALSAAVVVLEANSIQNTLKEIRDGNKCDKAEQLREIAKIMAEEDLPTTSDLDEECQAYLEVLATFPVSLPEVMAEEADDDDDISQFPQARCVAEAAIDETTATGTPIVERSEAPSSSASMFSRGSSFVESLTPRIRRPLAQTDEVVAVVVEEEDRGSSASSYFGLLV